MARHTRRHRRPHKPHQPPKPRARHPRTHHPRPPDVPSTHRDTAGDTFGRTRGSALPATGPHPALTGSHTVELTAGMTSGAGSPGLFGVILELVGAEHATLHQTLTLWQREQDRILNRAWRRPGGLARPAGL